MFVFCFLILGVLCKCIFDLEKRINKKLMYLNFNTTLPNFSKQNIPKNFAKSKKISTYVKLTLHIFIHTFINIKLAK